MSINKTELFKALDQVFSAENGYEIPDDAVAKGAHNHQRIMGHLIKVFFKTAAFKKMPLLHVLLHLPFKLFPGDNFPVGVWCLSLCLGKNIHG